VICLVCSGLLQEGGFRVGVCSAGCAEVCVVLLAGPSDLCVNTVTVTCPFEAPPPHTHTIFVHNV
jgi:hypothetical protein